MIMTIKCIAFDLDNTLWDCESFQIATELGDVKTNDQATFEAEFIEKGFHVFWHQRNNVVFYDGVIAMLERLSQKYSLGVITNGNADVNYIGIGDYFDFTMSSERAGVAKPHQDIFHKAMQQSEYNFSETIYVGDDPKCDVLGPQELGIKSIWYNPGLQPWPGGKTPAAVFRHHDELEDKISKL